jgi:hypothetical protein
MHAERISYDTGMQIEQLVIFKTGKLNPLVPVPEKKKYWHGCGFGLDPDANGLADQD